MRSPSRALRRRFFDIAIPLAVGGTLLLVVLDPQVEPGHLKRLGVVLAVVQAVALWWRRIYPATACRRSRSPTTWGSCGRAHPEV